MNATVPFVLLLLSGCLPSKFREGRTFAGGLHATARTLNKGRQIYMESCMACHGEKGDGKGVASKGMAVPPRDFTTGIIKFGDVVSGELPHDDAVYRTIERGLNGTAMLPWDLTPGEREAVWQYIKTFAPKVWEGREKKLGRGSCPARTPFGPARKTSAIELGRKVYHVTANCQSCHKAYVTPGEFAAMGGGEADEEFDKLKPQESDHGRKIIPPDFQFHRMRSVSGTDVRDIYLRVAAGVGGTTMPAWKDTLEDDEIWAVSHYVRHLMERRE